MNNWSGLAETYLLDKLQVGRSSCGDHICLEVDLGQLDSKVANASSPSMHQHPRPWLEVARLQRLYITSMLFDCYSLCTVNMVRDFAVAPGHHAAAQWIDYCTCTPESGTLK